MCIGFSLARKSAKHRAIPSSCACKLVREGPEEVVAPWSGTHE